MHTHTSMVFGWKLQIAWLDVVGEWGSVEVPALVVEDGVMEG